MSWRKRELLREALAGVLTNPVRSLVLLAATALCLGGLAFLELRDAGDLRSFAAAYRVSGGYVAVVSSSAGVDAATCDHLNNEGGVVASGAWRTAGQVEFSSAPGVPFQRVEITERLMRVWAPAARTVNPSQPSLIAGSALGKELGIREGLYLAAAGEEPAIISRVLDVTRRNPQAARWAMAIIPPSGRVQECWVEFEPGAYGAGLTSLSATFASADADPIARPFIRAGEFNRDPARELRARPQRLGWAGIAVLLAAVSMIVTWLRRAELGLYLALGATRTQLLALLASEQSLVVVSGLVIGFAWAIGIERLQGVPVTFDAVRLAAITCGSAALATLAIGPALATLAVRGDIAGLLKDR